MFRTGSPYSPFFTSGLMLSQTDYAADLESFLSFDNGESSMPPALPDSPRFIPLARPAPSMHLPSVPCMKRTTSSTSTTHRRINRSDALARLEGKSKRPALAPISHNFMSMSDDEGDDEMSDSDSFDDSDDESFIELPPSIIRRHAHSQSSPTILTTTSPSFFSSKSVRSLSSRSKHTSLSSRKPTLPLQSFIDLKDEESLRWRSFIEISVT